MPLYLPTTFKVPAGIETVYCDAGVILRNPSPHGGTYAFRYLDAAGNVLLEFSGMFLAAELPANLPTVENNLSELIGLLLSLEGTPHGWAGSLWCDNLNAIRRARDPNRAGFGGVPAAIKERVIQATRKRPGVGYGLVAGHPTRKELAEGHSGHLPVSVHNKRCDDLCKAQSRAWVKSQAANLSAG